MKDEQKEYGKTLGKINLMFREALGMEKGGLINKAIDTYASAFKLLRQVPYDKLRTPVLCAAYDGLSESLAERLERNMGKAKR